jgi:putative MATE family efflux protein
MDEIANKDDNTKKENKMGVLPIKKLLFSMSLPPMLSLLLNALYNIVDSVFVAKVSENALAAVTLVFPAQMLMIAINTGFGVGLSSLISRRLGKKQQQEADSAATHGLLTAVICWVLYACFGLFGAKPYLHLFTHNADILAMSLVYLRIVMVGSLFNCLMAVIGTILQATGDMIHPMIFNASGAVINVILNPILVLGLLGVPKLGVAGSATATITGQCIAMIIAVIIFVKNKRAVAVRIRGFRIDGGTIKNIFAVGVPSMIMISTMSFLIGGLNAILISYSTSAVAVLGVYFRVQSFVMLPTMGVIQGSLPIMGYNFGAHNRKRLMATFKLALKATFIILTIGTALLWIFPEQIMLLFSAKGDMLEIGVYALRIISISYIFAAFGTVATTFFQATGHGLYAMLVAILRQLVLVLPLAYVLLKTFGIDAVWFSFPIAEGVTLVMCIIFMRHVYKKQVSLLPEGNLTV